MRRYRAVLEAAAATEPCETLGLFQPCPNGVDASGSINRDKCVVGFAAAVLSPAAIAPRAHPFVYPASLSAAGLYSPRVRTPSLENRGPPPLQPRRLASTSTCCACVAPSLAWPSDRACCCPSTSAPSFGVPWLACLCAWRTWRPWRSNSPPPCAAWVMWARCVCVCVWPRLWLPGVSFWVVVVTPWAIRGAGAGCGDARAAVQPSACPHGSPRLGTNVVSRVLCW